MTSNKAIIDLRESIKSAKMTLNALIEGKKITSNKAIIAPSIRGSIRSVKMLLNALIDGKKITNHEVSKYATNSVKDILYGLKRDYGLNLLDEWVKDPKTGTRYKKYFINKSGIAYARLLLSYFTKKDKALLAKLNIRAKAKEPKKC